ncbi:MAG: PilT/PilU family type 4a pilus ATPase [Xanthomonadales bacterium]|nr:Twitching mobility protein [Xanthomonadales bacterium]MCC6593818.1 PilT/PilU family type 4a pilus ATPase [Xanthomonadales bacterium]MCE7930628.1 PilT/PilU family type 4a pilus ATPase [Xanthomonadales bacterium PRO6]
MRDLNSYLQLMARQKASDCFFSAGAPPSIKIEGNTVHLGDVPLSGEQVRAMAFGVMSEQQQRDYEAALEMNLALALPNIGRFRINIYRQRGEVAIAVRYITQEIPSLEQLNLPEKLKDLIMLPRGLVLVVGSTGSGKSTTLASMIDYRNQMRTGHILTIEEPIEYLHRHRRSIVDQREIGLDTLSYENALKNAMREAPDVIMIGEIRDREIMKHAIAYAETGHLCLSTLHANNANQALDRIINFFPDSARRQLLVDLSLNLQAVVSMRLVRGVDGKRLPAVELMLRTPYVADLISKGEIDLLKDAMKQGIDLGMLTFDESLYRLYRDGRIGYDEALDNADSRTDLALRIRLTTPTGEAGGLEMEEIEDPPTDTGFMYGKAGSERGR